MMSMKKLAVLLTLSFICVSCDQSTKYAARHFLEGRPTLSFMGDTFRLRYTENKGAFLGLGAGLPENTRRTLFVVWVSILLIGFSLYVIGRKGLGGSAISASALIIGGGLGNLMDRILHQGAVIDFMNIGLGSIRSGIFNAADVAIVAGGLMLAVRYATKPRRSARAADG
jgi:signal peptidase II